MFDILLKGATILDPSRQVDEKGSVAVKDGKIAGVGKELDAAEARTVYDLTGKVVTPGLIDIHCHPSAGVLDGGVVADETALATGVTTVCDAGSTGAGNFATMRRFIIDPSRTAIFCFLNLGHAGLVPVPLRGELVSEGDFGVEETRQVVEANRDIIRGIKIRLIDPLCQGVGMRAVEAAKKVAAELGIPLVIHVGEHRPRETGDPLDDLSRAAVSLLESGDIISHYLTDKAGGLILDDGTIYPELLAAAGRGVALDTCQGFNHFSFRTARRAFEAGLTPSVVTTDLSLNGMPVVQSLVVTMSKLLNLGLPLGDLVRMTTSRAARLIGEEERRGSLAPGRTADITVMEVTNGDYHFGDCRAGEILRAGQLIEPRMVLRAGVVLPAYSGYHPVPAAAVA